MAEPRPGAAILGFYGAIKICRRDGYDPEQLFHLVRLACFDQPENKTFEQHLEWASSVVRTWPKWKQTVLGALPCDENHDAL